MQSIFKTYFSSEKFTDKFPTHPQSAVDVLIPIIHTNELWEQNLLSIYREIPVSRLLIGNGGCIDNSLEIVKKFPRVTIFDHTSYTSLGYSIKKLIEQVSTDWFVYLHSDVYLPKGWFEEMSKNKSRFDWFECNQRITALIEYPLDYQGINRPFSGSQMGKKEIFSSALNKIDDDFLYRNEDIILADLIKQQGYRYGRVESTFHYHQLMHKESAWKRKFSSIDFSVDKSKEEDFRESNMQVRGIIKYLIPTPEHVNMIQVHLAKLLQRHSLNKKDFLRWVSETNPSWNSAIRMRLKRIAVINLIQKVAAFFFGWLHMK